MSRTEERRKAWLEAQKESLNRNGMARRDASTISTRSAAEAQRTLNTPDTAPAPRDHSVAAGVSSMNFGGRVRDRIEIKQSTEREQKKLTPAQIKHQQLTDFYYNEHLKEQAAAEEKREAEERTRQQQIEAEQRARQAKVEQAKRNREIEERNENIAAKNQIRAEIRAILADASPAEVEVVVARVKAEHCELFPDAYLIHLNLLREETEQALAKAAQERLEEQ